MLQFSEVVAKVNSQVAQSKQGRLYAVVHLAGKQLKITEGDVIIVEGYWPPECGEKIALNKVTSVVFDLTVIQKH